MELSVSQLNAATRARRASSLGKRYLPTLAVQGPSLGHIERGNQRGHRQEGGEDQASLQPQGPVVVGIHRPILAWTDGEHGPSNARPETETRADLEVSLTPVQATHPQQGGTDRSPRQPSHPAVGQDPCRTS